MGHYDEQRETARRWPPVKFEQKLTLSPNIKKQVAAKAEHTGGSSSYYSVAVLGALYDCDDYTAECLHLIDALGLTFSEANIFKAIWRTAAARMGKKKAGNNAVYDAEKCVFFAERMLATAKYAKKLADGEQLAGLQAMEEEMRNDG